MRAIVKLRPRSRHRQSGYVLLISLVLLTTTLLMVFLGRLDGTALRRMKEERTSLALAQAKEALIGYAISNVPPGQFPCPDVNNDGIADSGSTSCTADSLGNRDRGHLPWKTLGLGDLRDGDGECLWYALSTNSAFRIQPKTALARTPPLNTSTAGGITLEDALGNIVSVVPNKIIAIVFAPGAPIGAQSRTAGVNSPCASGDISNFLDIGPGLTPVNNATGNGIDHYVTAPHTSTFNDTLVIISDQDVKEALARRIVTELKGYATAGLAKYYNTYGHTLPCAAPINDGVPGTVSSGYFPYTALTFDSATTSWLQQNNWYGQLSSYVVTPDCTSIGAITATITLAGQAPLTLRFP